MKIYENGVYRDATAEEASVVRLASIQERTRPLTESEVSRLIIAQQINTLAVDGNTALRMLEFYPLWATGQSYETGFRVRHQDGLYQCIQAHDSQDGWEPTNAPALWKGINWTHAGTEDDPIPYNGNMALQAGNYYISGTAVYLCTRDTERPVYDPLEDLVGIYVTTVIG